MDYSYEVWFSAEDMGIDELIDFKVGDTMTTCRDEHMETFDTYDEAVWAMNHTNTCMTEIFIYADRTHLDVYETYLITFPLDENGLPYDDDRDWTWDYHSDRTFVNYDNGDDIVFNTFEEARKYVLDNYTKGERQ